VNTEGSSPRKIWLSRAFYAADLVAGFVKGRRCPSCLSSAARWLPTPGRRLSYFFQCDGCGLFFRRADCEAAHAGTGCKTRTLAFPWGTPTDDSDRRRR